MITESKASKLSHLHDSLSKANLKQQRKTARVFFSSPFGGLEEEREELTKKYWPQLTSMCKRAGYEFVPVDMRWGITSEMSSNAATIEICLREMDRSDMIVGFFGQVRRVKSYHLYKRRNYKTSYWKLICYYYYSLIKQSLLIAIVNQRSTACTARNTGSKVTWRLQQTMMRIKNTFTVQRIMCLLWFCVYVFNQSERKQ